MQIQRKIHVPISYIYDFSKAEKTNPKIPIMIPPLAQGLYHICKLTSYPTDQKFFIFPNIILTHYLSAHFHFTQFFFTHITFYQIYFAKLTFFRFLENLQISFILPNFHFAKPSFCQTLQFVVTLRMVLPLS